MLDIRMASRQHTLEEHESLKAKIESIGVKTAVA
jgi:hypothetical protein